MTKEAIEHIMLLAQRKVRLTNYIENHDFIGQIIVNSKYTRELSADCRERILHMILNDIHKQLNEVIEELDNY